MAMPIDDAGQSGGISPPDRAWPGWLSQMKIGSDLARSGDAAAAAGAFGRAAELRPGHGPTNRQLAAALLRAGEHAPALRLIDALLERAPGSSGDLHARGLALVGLGETGPALCAFRQAAAADPGAWKSLNSVADIALDERERVLALDRSADALLVLCRKASAAPAMFAACAEALIQAHRFAEAAEFTDLYAARFAQPFGALNLRARAHYNAGRFGDAFEAKINALALTPETGPALAQPSSKFDTGAATTALRDLLAVLKAHGVNAFLMAGTLLGFQRSGGPLAHDRDLDIGVIRTPDGSPDISEILRSDPRVLHPRAARAGDRYFGLSFKGVAADIFVYDPKNDGLVFGLGHMAGDIQWRVSRFDVSKRAYAGETWPVPKSPDRYLSEVYGANWQKPDKGFASAVSSPALFGTSVDARAYYAAARAMNALLAGDPEKAKALARQSPRAFDLPQYITHGCADIPDTEGPETD